MSVPRTACEMSLMLHTCAIYAELFFLFLGLFACFIRDNFLLC